MSDGSRRFTRDFPRIDVQEPEDPIGVEDRRLVVASMLCNPNTCDRLQNVLTPAVITAANPAYGELVRLALNFRSRRNRLPGYEELRAAVDRRRNAYSEAFIGDETDEITDLLDWAFGESDRLARLQGSALSETAIDYAKQWAEEHNAMSLSLALADGRAPADVVGLALNEYQNMQLRVRSLDAALVQPLFGGGLSAETFRPMQSTGLVSLDRMLGGGLEGGEVCLFMGPMGSCKTTATAMAVAEQSKACMALYQSGQGKRGTVNGQEDMPLRPVVVYVSYEAPKREAQRRLLSYSATVPWKRLRDSLGNIDFFSNGRTPMLPYELTEWGNRSPSFMPERNRIEAAIRLIDRHVLFVEIADGNPNLRTYGAGGVKDCEAIIRSQLRSFPGIYPYSFNLDHVSALFGRMVAKGGARPDDREFEIKEAVRQVGDALAKPFDATALVMHQLSGDANKKARNSAAVMHHTDGSGCASVAEFADFGVQTTMPTEDEHQLCRWSCTKHRREPPTTTPTIVRVDGDFGRLVDVSSEMTISRGEIVRRDDEGEGRVLAARRTPRAVSTDN